MNTYAFEINATVTQSYESTDPKSQRNDLFDDRIQQHNIRYKLGNVNFQILKTDPEKGSELTITSDFFTDGCENHIPDEEYINPEDNKAYSLISYNYLEKTLPERKQNVQDTITYKNVEQIDKIPESAVIEITDAETNQKQQVSMPLLQFEYKGYHWIDGFEFPVTVKDYDADAYMIGNKEIPANGENTFAGYEEQLLDLIGVNPDYYKIDNVVWNGEPWNDNGILYRKAIAKGKKQVADCSATYGGM
ncbi:hypothetical protein, partial [Serratia marcescens]|uniref:hypothetical protein n=1 Tax=Serratia marcescens TaxID=615 RepID=UPI0011E7E590